MRFLVAGFVLLLAGCSADERDFTPGGTSREPFMARPEPNAPVPDCELPGGTIGIPDLVADPLPLPDSGNGLSAGSGLGGSAGLPRTVALRNERQTFNRRYEFALHAGRVWYRSHAEVTGIEQPWAPLTMPSCLAGHVIGISVDDDELIALRADGKIYGMDNALKNPLLFNWSSRWGLPVWTGDGHIVPDDYLAWSWTVISPAEDHNWTDPAGNAHAIGQGKVSHIWLLRDGGQRFTYVDPWLPRDESYEMCGPQRGRFVGINLSASGSTIATVNRAGDIYTRHYDFDLGGNDDLFFDYSYEDQRGVSNPAIQLPTFAWVRQPRIPGSFTQNISIHKTGTDMIHRIVRVEGTNDGQSGYWQRDIADSVESGWQFVRTDEPLRGQFLGGTAETAPKKDSYYRHEPGDDDDWLGELLDFNVYCSPAQLRVRVAQDAPIELLLHTTDVIRQSERARGLDDDPRGFSGAVEIPAALFESLADQPAATQEFLQQHLQGRRFTTVTVSGVTDRISVDDLGWVFTAP